MHFCTVFPPLRNPYSVLCTLIQPFHFCTGLRPISTFAPFGSSPLYSILQPTIPLCCLLCTPYSVLYPATPLPVLVFTFAPFHRPPADLHLRTFPPLPSPYTQYSSQPVPFVGFSVICTPYSVIGFNLSTFPQELRSDLHLCTASATLRTLYSVLATATSSGASRR